MIMPFKRSSPILWIGLGFAFMMTPAFASGFGGTSPLGQNPDLFLTIAERQQLQKLRLSGKIKNIYQTDKNRLQALELDRYFVDQARHKRKNPQPSAD